jgi:hypothetical protein
MGLTSKTAIHCKFRRKESPDLGIVTQSIRLKLDWIELMKDEVIMKLVKAV